MNAPMPNRLGPAIAGPTRLADEGFQGSMVEAETKPKALGWHGVSTDPERGEKSTTIQVSFATRTPGPLHDLTDRRRGLTVDAYPMGRLLLLRCLGDVDGLERAAELHDSGREILYHARAGNEGTLLLDGNEDDEAIIASLADQNAHLLPPIRWQRGEAVVTLVLEDAADPQNVIDQFPGARLISKKRPTKRDGARGVLSSALFLPKLTEKQARALLAAYEAGYYEFPRKVTTDEVSISLGIARSTFEQHLNRAEHHALRAMLPFVRMRAGPAGGEALEVYSKFSRELGLYVQLELLGDRVAGVRLARQAAPGAVGSEHPHLARILEHVRTGEGDLRDIPLHLEVGPFERQVLEFLRTIPSGTTITYGEIARRLGRPGASRAVGTACARNPALIVIPCHRVVPKSGGLGGYSAEGGPETKRRLLEREAAPVAAHAATAAPADRPPRRKPVARSSVRTRRRSQAKGFNPADPSGH